jgi:hypothetical protein
MAEKESAPDEAAYLIAGGVAIAADEILLGLKFDGAAEFLGILARRKIGVAIARKAGISPDDEEVEAALTDFYQARDLFEEDQITTWLGAMHLTSEQVRRFASENALVARARLEIVTDQMIAERFASEHHAFAWAKTEVFQFDSAGKAREFILAVREEELTPAGGASLAIVRCRAPEEIAAELFSADLGALVGPHEEDDGSHSVFILRERSDAILDDELREEIRGIIFDETIDEELARDPLKFLR